LRHGWRPYTPLHLTQINPLEPCRFPILLKGDASIDGKEKRVNPKLPLMSRGIDHEGQANPAQGNGLAQ
jgi:hypothetical protein